MSTITKERAQEIFLGNGPEPTASEERELARIALASLEAEAVADVVVWSSPNEERTCDVRLRRHDINPGQLYAAPPMPVSVPEDLLHMAASAIEDLLDHCDPNTDYYSGVWADVPDKLRRAAMLQGAEPVTTAYKLPELTDSQCLEFLAVAFRHNRIKGDIEFDDIRLGLKIAFDAAPQQEVKP